MVFKFFAFALVIIVSARIDHVYSWEDSLKHVSERGVEGVDPSHGIEDIQQYYREFFEGNYWENSDDGKVKDQSHMTVYEKFIPGRFSVIFHQQTPDGIIDKTVALLKDAHERTNGKLKATHFVHLKHAAKGFFATLNQKLVEVVSSVSEWSPPGVTVRVEC